MADPVGKNCKSHFAAAVENGILSIESMFLQKRDILLPFFTRKLALDLSLLEVFAIMSHSFSTSELLGLQGI
jgi:hypothetical protein